MTIPLDPDTRKKLALVKQFYQQAVIQSSAGHSVLKRILAVINFDLAIETALKIAHNVLSEKKIRDKQFPNLKQAVNNLLKEESLGQIPHDGNITRVHEIRNDAQHELRYPSELEVEDCRIHTRDFLDAFVNQVWDVSLDSISITDLIGDQTTREFLEKAEQHLHQGDFKKAIENANAGLSWAIRQVPRIQLGDSFFWSRELTHGTTPVFSSLSVLNLNLDTGAWQAITGLQENVAKAFESISETIETMRENLARDAQTVQNMLVYLTLGLNYADQSRFSRIGGHVRFHKEGDEFKFVVFKMKDNPTQEDAEFAFIYCTDTVIQIESQVGSLDAPFH